MRRLASSLALGAAFLPALAVGGESQSAKDPVATPCPGFCDWLPENFGRLYRDKGNPWIDRVQIEGRLHWQYTTLDGNDVDGRDFNDSFDQLRRLRLEGRVDFLKYFQAQVGANFTDDERYKNEGGGIAYDDFSNAYLRFNAEKAFNLDFVDSLDLTYGRQRLKMGYEGHRSSNKIYTIERSSIAQKLGGLQSRPTGLLVSASKEAYSLDLGYFSHDNTDFIGSWNDGEFFYSSVGYECGDNWSFLGDLVLSSSDGDDESLGYGWASALSAVYKEKNRYGIAASLGFGDNGGESNGVSKPDRQDDFYGVMVLPWVWLIEDRLQLVAQAQYQESDAPEGIRLESRGIRAAEDVNLFNDVNNGRGDEHLSLYLGLNFHPCAGNTKIMTGIAYDELDTPDGKVDALAWHLAFRTYF